MITVRSLRELRELSAQPGVDVRHDTMTIQYPDGTRATIHSQIPSLPMVLFIANCFGGLADTWAKADGKERRQLLRNAGHTEDEIERILDQ